MKLNNVSVNVQINFNTCIYYDPYKSTKEGSGKFKLNETTTNPERTALSSMNTGGVMHIWTSQTLKKGLKKDSMRTYDLKLNKILTLLLSNWSCYIDDEERFLSHLWYLPHNKYS